MDAHDFAADYLRTAIKYPDGDHNCHDAVSHIAHFARVPLFERLEKIETRLAEQDERSDDIDAKVLQDDLTELMKVLGIDAHARPVSPHKVFQDEVLPAVRLLVASRECTIESADPAPGSGLKVVATLGSERAFSDGSPIIDVVVLRRDDINPAGTDVVLKSDADARIAELEAMVDRLHKRCGELYDSREGHLAWEEKEGLRNLYRSQCEQTARANETIGTLRAENARLKAERGPVVAYVDRVRNVWTPVTGTYKWTACSMGVRSLNQIARKFGPLVALHEGEPLEWDGEGER